MINRSFHYFTLLISCWILSCRSGPQTRYDLVKNATFGNGLVASAHPLASQVGKHILEEGGNAVDAAIAVQFALEVVFPEAGNIGGGGFMVIRLHDGSCYSLDFREAAPGKASESMYLDSAGHVIKNSSLLGHLASGVPGTVEGMVKAHERFGQLPWKKLLQPAIDLAGHGFLITASQAEDLNNDRDLLIRENTIRPDFLLKDRWKKGDMLVQKDLAHTLTLIRDLKQGGFYRGETADKIVSEMRRGKGIINEKDLANYRSVWREPVTGFYRSYKIISMGPPSSGGIGLLQLLKMVEPFRPDTLGWNNYRYIHLLAETEKRMFADRAEYMGDADYYPVPVSKLINGSYVRHRMNDFSFNKMTQDIHYGNLADTMESKETTHFSIIDKDRNAVSVTTTLNGYFGSKVIVGFAGFFLNNEMDDFSIKPGFPNIYGLTGHKANSIQPGKRMLSSMTPTIIEYNGELRGVLGSPGGSTIITTVFQALLNKIDFNMPLNEAVSGARFHHQGFPDRLIYENGRINDEANQPLTKMGYHMQETQSIGRVDAIWVVDHRLVGAADARGDDSIAGY